MTDTPETPSSARSARRPARWRRLLGRAVALTTSVALALGMAGLTWAGSRVPADQSTVVTATEVSAPAGEVVYACHAAPSNTLGAVSVGRTTATTTLTNLDEGAALTYEGETLTKPVTTLNEAAGGLLSVTSDGARSPAPWACRPR